MRRSLQYPRSHSQSQTHLIPQGAPQLQSRGFSGVNQMTHHPFNQSYTAQTQHQPYLRPASFSQSPYQQSESQSSAAVLSVTDDPHRMNANLPPSYMRIIRGPRSQEFEYEQDSGTYGHRGNVSRDQDTRGYTLSSEEVSQIATHPRSFRHRAHRNPLALFLWCTCCTSPVNPRPTR